MDRIGIIAGGGKLPLLIGERIQSKNYPVSFFCIKNLFILSDYSNQDVTEIDITSFSKILVALKSKNIKKIIMAGNVSRPSLKEIKFDLSTLSLIKDYFLESSGDDKLLQTISFFFNKNGYPLFDWKKICSDLFSQDTHLTINIPTKKAYKNLYKGLDIFKIIGMADIGQSMIVQNQLILGVESIEGTDELINRCSGYKRKGDGGILLKLSKYNQNNILDLPTIGIQTLQNLKNNYYEGLFIQKNECIIIEKEKVINFCNENNLFLSTVEKID